MKRVLFVSMLFMMTMAGYAKKSKVPDAVCGTWKYTNGTVINEFQHISSQSPYKEAAAEYLIFGENKDFRHDFVNAQQEVYKSLKRKWKIVDNKIKIIYTDIDFQLDLNYFFIDKDLVLGQNFSHVIFTKDVMTDNIHLAAVK